MLSAGGITAGQSITAEVTVTNTGKRAGDEVAQLYLRFPERAGAPLRALRGFHRVHLNPGQSQRIQFDLKPRDLSMVTEQGEIVVPAGEYSLSIGGGQPNTEAPVVDATFKVEGTVTLPE